MLLLIMEYCPTIRKHLHPLERDRKGLSLEAAELLENFQWTGSETDVPEKKVSIVEELADVLIYSIMMADVLHVDVNEIIKEKLKLNEEKYQVEKAYGSKKKYTELSK